MAVINERFDYIGNKNGYSSLDSNIKNSNNEALALLFEFSTDLNK